MYLFQQSLLGRNQPIARRDRPGALRPLTPCPNDTRPEGVHCTGFVATTVESTSKFPKDYKKRGRVQWFVMVAFLWLIFYQLCKIPDQAPLASTPSTRINCKIWGVDREGWWRMMRSNLPRSGRPPKLQMTLVNLKRYHRCHWLFYLPG